MSFAIIHKKIIVGMLKDEVNRLTYNTVTVLEWSIIATSINSRVSYKLIHLIYIN